MKVVIIGSGSIGTGIIPVLLKEFQELAASDITVISPSSLDTASSLGVGTRIREALTPGNFSSILVPYLHPGVFVLNLSVDVNSADIFDLVYRIGGHYLDTCIEPWANGYAVGGGQPFVHNAALRDGILRRAQASREFRKDYGNPTCALAMGANPGLVSSFVKEALYELSETHKVPRDIVAEGCGAIARHLGVRLIQIAERDTQNLDRKLYPGEFANTWSVDGFISEGRQRAELSYGSHETYEGEDITRPGQFDSNVALLRKTGFEQRVWSYTPTAGPDWAYLISHHEAVALGDYLSYHEYRPTVYYAYRPADAAVRSIENLLRRGAAQPKTKTVFAGTFGYDELGVLLVADTFTHWYGSTLSAAHARALMPYNGPTTLQVTATIAAAMHYIKRNPERGALEAEDFSSRFIMERTRPYLGLVTSFGVNWRQPGVNKLEQYLINN